MKDLTYTTGAPEAAFGLGPILLSLSQRYHQRKSLYSRSVLTAWADIADDGEEGTELHSLPVSMQLAGDRDRKGRLHRALPSTEINNKIGVIFSGRGNSLQFCIKELIDRCALTSHIF